MCECLKEVDATLAQHNCRLSTAFQITGDMGVRMRLTLATEKLDKSKRKPAPVVTASFCPFCGKKAT